MSGTKIVATIGPASQDKATLRKLIQSGVNVVRLNFSHGEAHEHIERANLVRAIAADLDTHVAILVDLQGPKIRISTFQQGSVDLKQGQAFVLDTKLGPKLGDVHSVSLDFPQLIEDVKAGHTLLLDDGRIQLLVDQVDHELGQVQTTALNSGKLSDRKGINLLGGGLSAPALTEKDKADIKTAAALDAEYLAVSFPRNGADMDYARELARDAGCNAKLIAKVERAEVVESDESMDDMIRASDVIMVARGDLGVEIGDARLPLVQKRLIARAKALCTPVITATQMLESMISNPLPTRAEVLDVANSILDGTDAIMLSAETAAGSYPVESVQAMKRVANGVVSERQKVCCSVDKASFQISSLEERLTLSTVRALAELTEHQQDLAIAVPVTTGRTATLVSRVSGGINIYALGTDKKLLAQLALLHNVTPVLLDTSGLNSAEVCERLKQRKDLGAVQKIHVTNRNGHGQTLCARTSISKGTRVAKSVETSGSPIVA